MLDRLGEQIRKLYDFIIVKKNIHHEAKTMVGAVKTAYNRFHKMEVGTWLVTTVQGTQTTLSLSDPENGRSTGGNDNTYHQPWPRKQTEGAKSFIARDQVGQEEKEKRAEGRTGGSEVEAA